MSASGKSSNRAYDERRWEHLETTSTQPSAGTPTPHVQPHAISTLVLEGGSLFPRRRFHETAATDDGYDRVYAGRFDEDAHGNCLTSSLVNSDLHAPVLDADHPVTVVGDENGYAVTFNHRVRRRRTRAVLQALMDGGLVSTKTQTSIDDLGTAPWYRSYAAGVTVFFDHPVIALPSQSAGHFHLLVEKALTWDAARVLARQLGRAQLTDARHARISSRGDFLFVYRNRTT